MVEEHEEVKDYIVLTMAESGMRAHGPVTQKEAWAFAARWNVAHNVPSGNDPVPGQVAVVLWLSPDLPRLTRLLDIGEAAERLFTPTPTGAPQ